MVQVRWTRLAVTDLKGIHSYISIGSAKYAKIQVLKIRDKVKVLCKYPLAGKPVPEYRNSRYRELIVGRYRIIYKLINKNQIDILTIHHAARVLSGRQIE
jgi:toxin ParE1/3/4